MSWREPRELSPGHIIFVPFLAVWLAGWAVGEVLVFVTLVFGRTESNTLLMLVWLAAWTIGGAEAAMRFVTAARGPAPERVVFTREHLCHVPSVSWNWSWLFRQVRGTKRGQRIGKHQLASLRLQNARPQRLLFGYGAAQIEIGTHLENSDREWLLDAIRDWASASGYR